MSECFIAEEQSQQSTAAGFWPEQTLDSHRLCVLLFIIPIAACLGGSCCIWTQRVVFETAFGSAHGQPFRSSSKQCAATTRSGTAKYWTERRMQDAHETAFCCRVLGGGDKTDRDVFLCSLRKWTDSVTQHRDTKSLCSSYFLN